MASRVTPSNKKDGSSYLDKFNKDKLIERCIDLVAQLDRAEKATQKFEKENIELIKKVESLQKKLEKYDTEDAIIKKILEYRARNYSPVFIRDKMILEGVDITLSTIKNILNGDLSTEHELFFKKCKQEYSESIKIDTSYYKQSSIDEFQRLIDSAYEDLENCDPEDIKTRDSLRNSISKMIAQRDILMKNIDENGDRTEEDDIADEATKKWSKESEDSIINIYEYVQNNKVKKNG